MAYTLNKDAYMVRTFNTAAGEWMKDPNGYAVLDEKRNPKWTGDTRPDTDPPKLSPADEKIRAKANGFTDTLAQTLRHAEQRTTLLGKLAKIDLYKNGNVEGMETVLGKHGAALESLVQMKDSGDADTHHMALLGMDSLGSSVFEKYFDGMKPGKVKQLQKTIRMGWKFYTKKVKRVYNEDMPLEINFTTDIPLMNKKGELVKKRGKQVMQMAQGKTLVGNLTELLKNAKDLESKLTKKTVSATDTYANLKNVLDVQAKPCTSIWCECPSPFAVMVMLIFGHFQPNNDMDATLKEALYNASAHLFHCIVSSEKAGFNHRKIGKRYSEKCKYYASRWYNAEALLYYMNVCDDTYQSLYAMSEEEKDTHRTAAATIHLHMKNAAKFLHMLDHQKVLTEPLKLAREFLRKVLSIPRHTNQTHHHHHSGHHGSGHGEINEGAIKNAAGVLKIVKILEKSGMYGLNVGHVGRGKRGRHHRGKGVRVGNK